ncbi:MAG: hypothetical protein PUH94_03480, partial [Firmicutes bacterium]|nr:hypothetical protein [Bacillota bacterium]
MPIMNFIIPLCIRFIRLNNFSVSEESIQKTEPLKFQGFLGFSALSRFAGLFCPFFNLCLQAVELGLASCLNIHVNIINNITRTGGV